MPVNIQEKRACWNSLAEFLDSNSFSNVIIVGDLNIILNEKEKSGGIYGKDPLLNLVDKFILSWELIDFKPKRVRFTWSNNRLGTTHISARLDRFQVFCLRSPLIISQYYYRSKMKRTLVPSHSVSAHCGKTLMDFLVL